MALRLDRQRNIQLSLNCGRKGSALVRCIVNLPTREAGKRDVATFLLFLGCAQAIASSSRTFWQACHASTFSRPACANRKSLRFAESSSRLTFAVFLFQLFQPPCLAQSRTGRS